MPEMLFNHVMSLLCVVTGFICFNRCAIYFAILFFVKQANSATICHSKYRHYLPDRGRFFQPNVGFASNKGDVNVDVARARCWRGLE